MGRQLMTKAERAGVGCKINMKSAKNKQVPKQVNTNNKKPKHFYSLETIFDEKIKEKYFNLKLFLTKKKSKELQFENLLCVIFFILI